MTFQTFNTDVILGLAQLPASSIPAFMADPPFGIDFGKEGTYNRDGTKVLKYREAPPDYWSFTLNWMTQLKRVLTDGASGFIFSGFNHLKDILMVLDELGFVTINHIIWKYQFGVRCSKKFVTSHYHILYVTNNDSKRQFFHRIPEEVKLPNGNNARYADLEDVWSINRVYHANETVCATQLPSELVQKCLAYISQENDLVLDCFMGSGQVGVDCVQMKRNYIGFEIEPETFEFATSQIKNESKQVRLM